MRKGEHMNPDPGPAEAAAGPVLVLDRLTKRYGAGAGVRALDLVLAPGELVALIGPSGCGKSTTLRLIAGHERPDGGTIRIAGRTVADRHRFTRPERRRVGLMFQQPTLFPHLSVAGNIGFGLDALSRPARRSRIAEALDLVRLDHLAERYPHELSGGEQQRVALARALAPRPAVLLLDEPFSSLDESLRTQIRRDTVAALADTGTTAVMVTHNQTEALSVGHRVAVMRHGAIEQVDTPQEVFDHPSSRFVASFVGDPTFLPTRLHRGRLRCEIGVVPTPAGVPLGDEDLEVVLRPHEVSIRPDPGSPAHVCAVEYQGAFVLHHIRLASGRTISSWQPHDVRLPLGAPVAVAVAEGSTPTLLAGDAAMASRAPDVGETPVPD
jgi:iron(III) transport system ATP-binding protein